MKTKKKYSIAKVYFLNAISSLYEDLPVYNKKKSDIYFHLATIYNQENRKDSADLYYTLSAEAIHVEDIKSYKEFIKFSNNADEFFNAGNYKKAEELYKKSLDLGRKAIKRNDEEIAQTYYRIGLCKAKGKQYQEAIELTWKAHDMWEKLSDSQNPNCIKALSHLYDYYNHIGDKKKVQEIEKRMKALNSLTDQ